MSSPAPPLLLDPSLRAVADIAQEYARAHAVDVWIWEVMASGCTLAFGTSERTSPPSGAAGSIRTVDDRILRVEIAGDAEQKSRFLATLIGQALQHQAETRFFGRELAERYEEITLLYTISEILGSVISLDEAATTILREVTDTMGVRKAALWIHDPNRETLELVAAVGVDVQEGPISVHETTSVTATVFRNRMPMILEPKEEYPREEERDEDSNRDPFLSVPVSYTPPDGESRTIGVINLIGRRVEESFTAGDQKLITAIASQVGAALENSRLVAESLRQERMVREMELAHDLQLKLLPSVDQFRGVAEVAARFDPADSVGGDFYHLLRLPGGRMGVMIGDVSSHGFASALIMALTMSAVAIHASEGDPPAEVLRRVHRALIDELESTEMYMTLFYAVIDPHQGRLTYANAGHHHSFRITAEGEAQRLGATNPPFGLVDLDDYREEVAEWRSGADLLVLFTDGLSESINPHDGEGALLREIVRGRHKPLDEVIRGLFELPGAASDLPVDDRTAVLLRI